MPPSKTKVDKAGALLRAWWADQSVPADRATVAALQLVWDYRALFQYPTTKINANLRHYVKKAGCEVLIAQRMKRLPRILEKLKRHPRMRLTQMQDVGGCRSILPNQEAVEAVFIGLKKNWDIITVDDYVSKPKDDGYRGLHVIARRDDVPIEVQLRTIGQQDWADEVERIDGRVPEAVKDGEGQEEVRRYLWLLAEVIAAVEAGVPPQAEWVQELRRLRPAVP